MPRARITSLASGCVASQILYARAASSKRPACMAASADARGRDDCAAAETATTAMTMAAASARARDDETVGFRMLVSIPAVEDDGRVREPHPPEQTPRSGPVRN